MTPIREQIRRLREAAQHGHDQRHSAYERLGFLRARCEDVAAVLEQIAARVEPLPDPDRDRTDWKEEQRRLEEAIYGRSCDR